MERNLSISDLREVGISRPYATMILNGQRKPSRPLAIRILRRTGWRHPLLDGLTDEQINVLEQVEPWKGSTAA